MFSIILYCFVEHNAAIVDFRNRILNTLNDIKFLSLQVSILHVIHAFFDYSSKLSKYYQSYIIKIKVSYIYQVKASVIVFLFHFTVLIIQLDTMYLLAISWGPLALTLSLYGLSYDLKIVIITAPTKFVVICNALGLWYPAPEYLQNFPFSSHWCCPFTAYYYCYNYSSCFLC